VEGDKAYLDRFVETSKVLKFVKRDPIPNKNKLSSSSSSSLPYPFPYDRCIDFVEENSVLVFGGDLWDKGGFDLYVTRQLLDLKRRHPSRVLWVLGNRDINKLRILQELGLPGSTSKMPYHPGLTWFRGSGKVGDPEGNLPPTDPGERLRWMLSQTMGSPDAMEHRRQELVWEANGCTSDNATNGNGEIRIISDLDVVRSYQRSCHPEGELGLFLSQALLAARIGPVLFVHGSLPLTAEVMARAKKESKNLWDDLTFCMPWIPKTESAKDYGVETIEDWLHALNQFCDDNIERWKKDIARLEENQKTYGDYFNGTPEEESAKDSIWAYRAGYNNGPPYSDLIQYGMGMTPDGKKNPTVVYNSFTPEGMPTSFLPPEKRQDESDVAACTRSFFDRSSIQLILTGHKPQGDMPSPIRVDDSSWVICADTSYSGDTIWWHNHGKNTSGDMHEEDNAEITSIKSATSTANSVSKLRSNLGRGDSISFRGDVAVSEVLVCLSNHGNSLEYVKYHGVLSDGTEYESINLLDAASQNTTVGQVAPDDLVPNVLDSPHQGVWWTKSIFSDGSHLFHAGEGFNVWNYVVSTEDHSNSNQNTTTNNT
jgi:hypothetical protein